MYFPKYGGDDDDDNNIDNDDDGDDGDDDNDGDDDGHRVDGDTDDGDGGDSDDYVDGFVMMVMILLLKPESQFVPLSLPRTSVSMTHVTTTQPVSLVLHAKDIVVSALPDSPVKIAKTVKIFTFLFECFVLLWKSSQSL